MAEATSYAEWREAAAAHDKLTGMDGWRDSDESDHYDFKSIRQRLNRLKNLRRKRDNKGLLFALNEGIHGNMDGMGNERLFLKAKLGTKKLIEAYVNEVADALEYLAGPTVSDIDPDEKLAFFIRAHHCYGQSALMMSGSGTFLYFHFGVVKAMWSEGLLPRIISGSSGGSIVGALICTHTDKDIGQFLDYDWLANRIGPERMREESLSNRLTGAEVRAHIEDMIPDLTFQEAYELTGRHLNVSIAPAERHQNSRLLNAIASPNVFIREAVLASCAVPGVFDPVMLMARDDSGARVPYLPGRKWVDGSVTNDLPAKRLARLYGVNHHIVSQANPLATPFASDMKSQDAPLAAIRTAAIATMRAWVNANMAIMAKPLSYFPVLNSAANITLSIINQDYGGDINIVRPPRFWSINKILGYLTPEEIEDLVITGERTTWPRIEMIRTQTRISQALADILSRTEPGRQTRRKRAANDR